MSPRLQWAVAIHGRRPNLARRPLSLIERKERPDECARLFPFLEESHDSRYDSGRYCRDDDVRNGRRRDRLGRQAEAQPVTANSLLGEDIVEPLTSGLV